MSKKQQQPRFVEEKFQRWVGEVRGNHVGGRHAIHAGALERAVGVHQDTSSLDSANGDGAVSRMFVGEANRRGIPIVADHRGYFYPENADEAMACRDILLKKADSLFDRAKALRLAIEETF